MFYYAQLNEENICVGVSQLSGEVSNPVMIELSNLDSNTLGKRHNEGVWEDVERPEPYPEPTNIELIMQANTDGELRDLEIQQNQEMLAQQMADIELALLGGI